MNQRKIKHIYRTIYLQLLIPIICLFMFENKIYAYNTPFDFDTCQIRQNSILINSGYFNYASIDNLFSDNVYSGGNLFYGLKYDSKKINLIHSAIKFSIFDRVPKSLQIDPSLATADSRFVNIKQFHFEMENIYRYKVLDSKSKYANIYFSTNWCTLADWVMNDQMNPELIISSIAPGFYYEYNIKNIKLYIQFSTSLLSYTCRNSYSFSRSDDNETYGSIDFLKDNSHIQFPNTLITYLTNAGFNINISKHWGINGEYYFRYITDSEPRVLKSVTNICSIGLTYTFVK